jgi:O-methyltransferase/methyltransferase family protein
MSEAASPQAPPPQAQLMQMAMGFTSTFLLRVAAQMRLADHLADGPKTADQLAALTNTHSPALYRVLRTLASLGIFSEDEAHQFFLTPLAEPLRSNVPGSVRTSILSITGDIFVIPWSKLLYSVQTGQPSFDNHYGVPFFDHLKTAPQEATMFSDLLIGINSGDAPAVAAAYDFSAFTNIADIGGSTGHMLTTVLASHAGPRGTLFDLPHIESGAIELIRARDLADRVTFVPGSFFETIPSGGDLYMLSHVIHDWSEDQCLTILANCHRAMSPASRLLVIETVLSEGNAFHPGKMLDITMLTLAGGQERSEPEYRALLAKANFKLIRVIPTNSPVSIVEAIPV